MRVVLTTVLIVLACGAVQANEVEIVETVFQKNRDSWSVDTTLRHADSGWDHYADAWRVVDEQGKELGRRTLFHPHETEQPFTRSLGQLTVPEGTSIVFVEAHDKVHGWSKQRIKVDLSSSAGERYKVEK